VCQRHWKIEQECKVEISYRGKKVFRQGYIERKVHIATQKVQDKVKSLKSIRRNLNCSHAISAYVHHRLFEQKMSQTDTEFLSSLQTNVFTENNEVWLEGSVGVIDDDEQKLLEYLVKKLQHQQFHFDNDSRFIPQIEKTILCDLHKKYSFTHLVFCHAERPDTPRKDYRQSSRSSLGMDDKPRRRMSSRSEDGFTITIYSSSDEDFKHVSSSLKVGYCFIRVDIFVFLFTLLDIQMTQLSVGNVVYNK